MFYLTRRCDIVLGVRRPWAKGAEEKDELEWNAKHEAEEILGQPETRFRFADLSRQSLAMLTSISIFSKNRPELCEHDRAFA